MVREAPLRDDRAAARDDPRHAHRRHRHVAQQHAGVHGEVVHPLLRLLDERVAVDLPGEVLGRAAALLERLVDRHRPDRHGRVPEDPLAGLVDVLARGQVHHRVGAPERRPAELLDLFLDGRGDRRVPDVGVDLHREVPADDHRLELGMIDVRRDDRPPARDLAPHELGGHPLAQRDELHLLGDLPAARELHLRDHRAAAARRDPRRAQLREPVAHVVAARSARVVDAQRRLAAARARSRAPARARRAARPRTLCSNSGRRPDSPSPAAGTPLGFAIMAHPSLREAAGSRTAPRGNEKRATEMARDGAGGHPATTHRAPYAGSTRIRFQGTLSTPIAPEYPWRLLMESRETARRRGNGLSAERRERVRARARCSSLRRAQCRARAPSTNSSTSTLPFAPLPTFAALSCAITDPRGPPMPYDIESFIKDYRITDGSGFKLSKIDPNDTRGLEDKKQAQEGPQGRREDARRAPGQALRPGPVGRPAHLPGDGRRREGRRDQARHVRRQSAGLPGLLLQVALRGGARSRLPLAHLEEPPRARPHRDLQPVVLRGSARRARARGLPRQAEDPEEARHEEDLGATASRTSTTSSCTSTGTASSSGSSSSTSPRTSRSSASSAGSRTRTATGSSRAPTRASAASGTST